MRASLTTYIDPESIPSLPGIGNITVDESIVLPNSEAITGVRIAQGGVSTECEIFFPACDYYYDENGDNINYDSSVEVYPLTNDSQPFIAPLERSHTFTVTDDDVVNSLKSALYQRNLN